MRLLLHQELSDSYRDIAVFKSFLIRLLRCILALLGGVEKSMVSAAQMRLHIAPDPVDGTGGSATDILAAQSGCGL